MVADTVSLGPPASGRNNISIPTIAVPHIRPGSRPAGWRTRSGAVRPCFTPDAIDRIGGRTLHLRDPPLAQRDAGPGTKVAEPRSTGPAGAGYRPRVPVTKRAG